TRIRELRKMKGMNQKEFGAKIGLSQRAVSEIEIGTNVVTDRNFDAICKAFNVNPAWLRDGVGEIFVETREALIQSLVDEFDLKPNEAVLLKTFLELPAEHRKGVLKWAENFARTMALQLGVDFPQREEMPENPTTEQKRAIMNRELDAEAAAIKKGASLAFTTTLGSRKNFGNGS
ncbi:MAG: helix-turn-helix transcriptional regulator, partial [Selenomonadaceae bacterium]|nr:helix-turn-helix transcriptional regulator [Selenomonadaceae bacterium]